MKLLIFTKIVIDIIKTPNISTFNINLMRNVISYFPIHHFSRLMRPPIASLIPAFFPHLSKNIQRIALKNSKSRNNTQETFPILNFA